MIYENKFYHLVLNSKDFFYLFELDNIGSLSYKVYSMDFELMDKYFLEENNVLKYCIVLDNLNNIKLAYLMKNGELHLNTLKGDKWDNSIIAYFDTKSNRYNQFEMLFIKDKLHLIYTYANLINSNIYTIQHIIYDNNIEEKHNIIRYVSRKLGDPFTIDVDNLETIHLLYNTVTNNESYIFHSYYSPYTRGWSNNPKELSSRDSQNISPYLFIDSESNLHGIWIEKNKNLNTIKYLRMPTKGKEKYIWKPIKISYIFPQDNRPIIYEENSLLKIVYTSNNELSFISSSDYGLSWSKEGKVNTDLNISIMKLTTSPRLYPNIKANHVLGKGGINPSVYLLNTLSSNDKISGRDKSQVKVRIQNPVENPEVKTEEKHIEPINESDSSICEFSNEILTLSNDIERVNIDLENIVESQKELKIILNKVLEKEEFLLDCIKEIQNSLENNKSTFWDRLFKS